MNEKEKVDRNCDKCKYTDNKSSRYPCSECADYTLDKWEAPDSKNDVEDKKVWNIMHNIFLGCGFNWNDATEYNNLHKDTGLSLTDYLLFKILLKLDTKL